MSRQLRLMPPSSQRRKTAVEAWWLWSWVTAGAVLLSSAVSGYELWQGRHAAQQREALEAQHAPIRQLRAEIARLKRQIVMLSDEERLALALSNRQPMVSLLGWISQAAAYAGGDLFVESLRFNRRPATQDQQETFALQLEGIADNNLEITRFAEKLREAELFGDVQLSSTVARVIAGQSVTAFELECVF